MKTKKTTKKKNKKENEVTKYLKNKYRHSSDKTDIQNLWNTPKPQYVLFSP